MARNSIASMQLKVIKLKFSTGIHYGNFGRPGLLRTDRYIASDTLYSAFCDISPTNIDKLYKLVEQGKLLISDALPYVKENLLLPKPPIGIKIKEEEIDRTLYKKLKRVEFVPFNKYKEIVTEATEETIKETILLNEQIGSFDERTFNSVSRGDDNTVPYVVSTFNYYKDSGLYIVVKYKDEEDFNFIKGLIEDLGYVGVGGKRSSGLGKYEIVEILDFDEPKEGKYILYSTSLSFELSDDTYFNVLKRSGFYRTKDNFYKKRDIYAIKSGLLLDEPFEGVILDDLSEHDKIYRFLMPLFVRVELWKKKHIK